MYIKPRSPIAVILLTLLTCGIYSIYWLYVTSRDLQELERDMDSTSPFVEILLIFVTCGIYTFFWYYKYAKKVAVIQTNKNMAPVDNNGVLYIVLLFFGLGIVSAAIMQSTINNTILIDD